MIFVGIKRYLDYVFFGLNDIFWFKLYLNEISHSPLVILSIFTLNGGNQTGMERHLNRTENRL
jgi:hypothetical protein